MEEIEEEEEEEEMEEDEEEELEEEPVMPRFVWFCSGRCDKPEIDDSP